MLIEFINTSNAPTMKSPVSAIKEIPDWWRSMKRYRDNKKEPSTEGAGLGTIKTCMPVFDSMTSGYLLFSPADVFVRKSEENQYGYQWPHHDAIHMHPRWQVSDYPNNTKFLEKNDVPKFRNYWAIRTPKGYSCLFITPMHRDIPFTIFPGIVDTDTHYEPVNFPFIPNPDFEGMIEAGTPIAQVIPFRRENWEMSVKNINDSKEIWTSLHGYSQNLFASFFDRYKKTSWRAKEYK